MALVAVFCDCVVLPAMLLHCEQALERWKERKEELARQYEGEIASAKTNHAENVARAQQEWQDRKVEVS